MEFRTVYPFRLPRGYVDAEGTLHREGQMRPATAIDELSAMRDPRAKADEGYMERLLFSKVVIALGTLPEVTPEVIGGLSPADMGALRDMYEAMDRMEPPGFR
ncbi:phage tail assembly protein [uncultured Oscillibacter sp.]|uniref:phage tail assembly protein n=1 Tax=uncultured Oscillibacter sp. TaxID=876091 RepID=UPI0025F44D13|nr:phage tail assembly protein [uncultured Oscillibacter sp.]